MLYMLVKYEVKQVPAEEIVHQNKSGFGKLATQKKQRSKIYKEGIHGVLTILSLLRPTIWFAY